MPHFHPTKPSRPRPSKSSGPRRLFGARLTGARLLGGLGLAVCSLPALAQGEAIPRFTDPAAIDRAVAEFTGVAIGAIGGARAPTDRRLRLAGCAAPLAVDWHGTNRSTLKVECEGPETWRIFVATRPEARSAPKAPAVSRGDPVTIVVRGQGFSVQQSGEAMETGRVGDWIAIRTARRAEPIRARIERPGLAVIPSQ